MDTQGQQPLPWRFGQQVLQGLARQPFARVLYNHNPFYVISAALVFWGLRNSFDTATDAFNAWPLTLSLAAFTILLVTTAVLIVRWGKVWEDARSILLLVVLMFLGMSVTFDSILANSPAVAKWYYLGGLAFAVAVTETALRSLPLRLPALYRAPFYLIVALFYLYPLLMTGRLTTPRDPVLQWQLFGFSTVAACIFLSLLPAIRRGSAYADDNFSPWRWPLFPWTLFGVLWLCVCLRAYYLCQSLHFVGYSDSIFGWYFLAPMLLAAAALFLEGGRISGSQMANRVGIGLPIAMVALCAIDQHNDLVYLDFLELFRARLFATPLFVAVVMAIAFYTVAAMRRFERAHTMLMLSVLALAIVGPETLDLRESRVEQTWPLAMVGMLQLVIGLSRSESHRVAIGACLMLAASIVQWQGTWFTAHLAIIPLHLLLAIFLIVGLAFRDDVARRLRRWSAVLMVALALLAIFQRASAFADLPRLLVILQPLALTAAAIWIGRNLRMPGYYATAATIGVVWCGVYGTEGYREARLYLPGLDQLAIGLFFFGCAALISLAKAGVLQRWIGRFLERWKRQSVSSGYRVKLTSLPRMASN